MLFDVSLTVSSGSIVCLLGLNGMGKTTTLRSIMGLVSARATRIQLDNVELPTAPHLRARAGLALVPEDRQVFPTLTVEENLRVPRAAKGTVGVPDSEIFGMFPRLAERRRQIAGSLSGGEQQMLSMARALVSDPTIMLLDEPSEGLAPAYVAVVKDSIEAMKRRGIGVLLVENNLEVAKQLGDEFYAIQKGEIVDHLSRADIKGDQSKVDKWLSLETAD